MIFNSVTYIFFAFVIVLLYWVLPRRPRLWLVFIASLTFYGFWRIEFIPLILFSTFVDYIASLAIYRSHDNARKKIFLIISITINLGLLFYFKYLYFFVDNTIDVLKFIGFEVETPIPNIILPLGISFYTFQTISYTVDVYRGFIKPEKDFVLYGCYILYFPQLIAGPILRAREVIHQFNRRPKFNVYDFGHGIRWILYGLFLKVVFADNLAPLVDEGFVQQTQTLSALDVWSLAFLFGFQIYFDFSAYSMIAIGSARLMGLHFPENFHYPYLAHSPREFWRRWHISLSSWIRDYLYLPLAGIRVDDRSTGGLAVAARETPQVPKRNLIFVLLLTWAIMGLWHGASWRFVVWGLYHAVFLLMYRLCSKWTNDWPDVWRKLIGWSITLPVIMLSWIPFQTQSIADTVAMWKKIVLFKEYSWLGMRENTYLIVVCVFIMVIATYHIRKAYHAGLIKIRVLRLAMETVVFAVVIGLVFVFLRPINQFIYFQF